MSDETAVPQTAPEGWIPLPIDTRPIWSPDRCKRPVQGMIETVVQFGPRPTDRGLVLKLDVETDVVAIDDTVRTVKAGEAILMPLNYVLLGLVQLVQEKAAQGQKISAWIGEPTKLGVLGTELYGFEIRMNPVLTPR